MDNKNQELKELQKKHKEQLAEARQKVRDRKARTHRLITRGAYVESLIEGADKMTDEQFKNQLSRMISGWWEPGL